MWSEGQWEASKKTALNGADRQTEAQTHRRTWRLYDQLGPVGPSWWKLHRPKLLVCVWAHWNFDFTPELQHPLAHYQGPIVRNVFYKKDAYGKYLLFATLGSYVAWLVTKVFKFPWRVIFGGFSVEVEQRPKLVSAHPQIPLWYENAWWCGIALFVTWFFPLL